MTVTLDVYLLESTLAFDRHYTYLAEEAPGQERALRRGSFVFVPFGLGNRTMEAVVWNVREGADDAGRKLKYILRAGSDEPLSEREFSLCMGLCGRYACTPGAAVQCIRPFRGKTSALSRTVETVSLAVPAAEALELVKKTVLKNIWQIRIIEYLCSSGGERADADKVLFVTGAKKDHLKQLEKKGYITRAEREAGDGDMQTEDGTENYALDTYSEHKLNDGQQKAYDAVRECVDGGGGGRFLLHGVTGSGKTEVYMHLISHVLARGGYAVMMVPEISLTPQMISHFTSRFGRNVSVWHSGLTDGVRHREWYRMKKGLARVAVCTRSGIFIPFPKADLVIIDEAHDGSYRSEESGLRFDAREVAELRFGKEAAIVYGSATPDVSTYYRALNGDIKLLTLDKRAGAGSMPEIRIADMREERAGVARGGLFSEMLLDAMRDNYASGGQTMLFVGRRGYSSRLFCRDCGRSMVCASCGLPMTYHNAAERLLCNYCGKVVPAPVKCPACGSSALGFGSPGTERVEESVRKLFPGAGVLRMDSDTVHGRDGHGAVLRKFQKEKVPFLIGTQMITKGHDFPGVTLVGIIDADGQINQPEYNAGERAYQILTQVAGRAGRGERPGTVVIQTYNVDDSSVRAVLDGDYGSFYAREIAFRRAMMYPPFCSLCRIRVSGTDDRDVYDRLSAFAEAMRKDGANASPDGPSVRVLGPSREPVAKVGGRYRWQLTLKAADREQIIGLFFRQYAKMVTARDIRLALVFEN